jgi:hypothetical protein
VRIGLRFRLVVPVATFFLVSAVVVGLADAPAAYAGFVPAGTGACAGVGPPAGQTGGDYWVNGEDGSCTGDWISQDDLTSIINRTVAGGDRAIGVQIPSDIPASDADAGSSMWDSLANATSAMKGSALDFLSGLGDWPPFSELGSIGLGAAGSFVVGWEVGSSIADLLGIDSGPSESGPEPFDVASLDSVTGGTPLANAGYSADYCGGWSGGGCTATGTLAPSDGWIAVNTSANADVWENPDCPRTLSGMPADAVPFITETWPAGYDWCTGQGNSGDTKVYFVPATVTALPGPGQGSSAPSTTYDPTGWPPPSETQQKQNAKAVLQSSANDTFTEYECAQFGPSGPCPFWSLVPTPSANESAADYETQLAQAGFQANVTTLPETDTTVGDGDVVETNPEPGSIVGPDSTVDVAVNPKPPKVTQEDPRCDVDNGAGSPGDPGNPPPDGTNYPAYQLVQGSPYPADVDPTNSSPPKTEIPLRWGTTGWGWRHILQEHPYTGADEEQTMQALAIDSDPDPGWQTTNQWVFHYFYTEPDGQGDGGTITCVRSVSVEYWQSDKEIKAGVTGIRGIQDSYTGLYTGGVPGH